MAGKKLCNEVIKKLAHYTSEGLPYDSAAALCGIKEKTLINWLARAKKDDEKDPLIYKLAWAMEAGHAKFVHRNVNNIDAAGKAGNVKASQWLLEKRDARNFAKKEQEEVPVSRVIVVPAVQSIDEWMEKHGDKSPTEADAP